MRSLSLIDKLKGEIEQRNNKPFLKAAMAAAALAAHADGHLSFAGRYRVDQVLETVRELRIYDPHKAVDILDRFLEHLAGEGEAAARVLRAKIGRFAGDYKSARTLLRIAYFIATADGPCGAEERAALRAICDTLGVDPAEIFDKLEDARTP